MRMPDDTFVSPDDEEVAGDEATDEFAAVFNGEATPKIMITTRPRPTHGVFPLIQELMHVIPNSFFYKRGALGALICLRVCLNSFACRRVSSKRDLRVRC